MPDPDTATPGEQEPRSRPRLEGLALWLVVGLPILVLVAVLAGRTWYPTGDLAQAELRMRSLPRHPPLVGAAGRIVDEAGRQGNHPGPLMFWATWPLYVLLGRSAWAFEAATAIVNLLWLGLAVWIVRVRTNLAITAWFGAVALVLLGGFGLDALSQPWNPWVALLPYLVLVLAAWRSLDGWPWAGLVAVAAASYAIQGHAGYAPIALPLVLVAIAAPLWRWIQTPLFDGDGRRGSPLGVLVMAPFLALVLWAGPLWDLATSEPTNVRKLLDNFGSPTEPPLGVAEGIRTLIRGLAPTGAWVRGGQLLDGSIAPGLLLLLAWAGVAVAVAWRHRGREHRRLLELDAIIAVSLVFGAYAVSRIFGAPFLYTYRWVAVLTALLVFTLGWGIAALLPPIPEAARRALAVTGLALLVLLSAITAVRVGRQDIPYGYTGRMEAVLAPATAGALGRSDGDAKGKTYRIDWEGDLVYLGGLGHGLLLDLERRGYTVGARPEYAAAVEPHRVLCPNQADAILTVITGPRAIERWRAMEGTRLLARVGSEEGFDYDATFRNLLGLMREADPQIRADRLEQALVQVTLNPSAPPEASELASELVRHGVPTAVFLQDPAPDEEPVAKVPTTEPCWKR